MNEIQTSFANMISSLPFQKNNYQFLSFIEAGGSSYVFKVRSLKYENIFFAAKVTPKAMHINTSDLNALKLLFHSYIIRVYDHFEDENFNYIIMDFCENGSLSSLIKSGKLNRNVEIIFYMKKITEAIYFCHLAGIAHRDIKPSNILLDSYGRPKLIDFGICKILYSNGDDYFSAKKQGRVKLIKEFSGSLPYLAPEIILNDPHDPFASDVWALGITFYEIATGNLPWSYVSENFMKNFICQGSISFPTSMPSPIRKLIAAMTNVDPQRRPTLKAIVNCSLFKTEIPKILTLFKIRRSQTEKNLMLFNDDLNNDLNEKVDRSDRKLKRVSTRCVSFSHCESFLNNALDTQMVTSSLVFKLSNKNERIRTLTTNARSKSLNVK